MAEVVNAPHGVRALALVLQYLLLINERITPQHLEHALASSLPEATKKEVIMTYGEMLIEQGIEQGIEKGRLAEKAQTLFRFLTKRGLSVSEPERQRILTCGSAALLDQWIDRVLDVAHTEQLFAGSPKESAELKE